MYECVYKLQSKATKANDTLHFLGVKCVFYVTRDMASGKSAKSLEAELTAKRKKERSDSEASVEIDLEEGVEAVEIPSAGDGEDKFDQLNEVWILSFFL